ncbi:transcription factor GTE4-like [Amaranthus tricolor]|uniref:transcription factor GTE4-like n=1 Tax=Amaranthus tricolor TaxID=29722 RepID=UPI002590BC02|nr:transcription factor GTE4-like [Amaranthus tricolor]
MASETSGADKLPKEKYLWSENCKVYTRRIHRKIIDVVKNHDPLTTIAAATTTTTSKASENENNSASSDKSNSLKESNVPNNHHAVNGVTATVNNNVNLEHEKDNTEDDLQNLPNSSSPPKDAVEEAKSLQLEQNLSQVEAVEEANSFQLQQNLSQVEAVEEANSLQLQRNLSQVEAVEEANSLQLRQNLSQVEAVEEANSLQLQQNLSQVEAVEEANSLQLQQNLSQVEAVEEANSLQLQRNLSQVEAVEEANSLQFQRNLSQVEAVEEANSLQLQQNLSQVEAVEEANSLQLQQNLSQMKVVEEANSLQLQQNLSHVEAVEEANSLKLQQNLSPVEAVEEANSLRLQQNLSKVVVSGDSSSLNRAEAFLPHGFGGDLNNRLVSRPLVTQVGDRLTINVSAASSMEEVRDLKRKLEDELDQVRNMAKKLEAKEIEISRYSSITGNGSLIPVDGHLQYPVNGGNEMVGSGMRMGSEMGLVSFNKSRPFRQLSVSVINNNQYHGVGDIIERDKRTPKANQLYRKSEFLLGMDKLPPENNRKTKSSGSKKHGGSNFDYGFRIDKKCFSKCSTLLQKLMNHKHGWVFNQPVDVKTLGLHDYFDIIKHPMDLGTIKSRLTKNWYKTPREFAEDVRLTFHNALTYNSPGQDVHIMAQELYRMFEARWPAIETDYDRNLRSEMLRDMGVPTPTSRKIYSHVPVLTPRSFAPPPRLQPTPFHDARNFERSYSMPVRQESTPKPTYSVGRKPALTKPKAKDPHKRNMTSEEKQKLGTNLQNLPAEKVDTLIQIVKKRNSYVSQKDNEIELDFETLDVETLWDLDRFVTNYKKTLSKHKRKAEIAQARAAAAQAAQETIPAPAYTEAPRDTTADETNVATSPRAQPERHSDNDSDSSSSSSSSSDSGSSSSDSDSDSSSASDSDGG